MPSLPECDHEPLSHLALRSKKISVFLRKSQLRNPRDQVLSNKEDVFAVERQRAGSKRQKQEAEDERKKEKSKGEEEEVFVPVDGGRTKNCHREDTDMAHRQTTVYKVKGETLY